MVFKHRLERLQRIREQEKRTPGALAVLKQFYRDDPAQFIIDWGVTFDPRNGARGLPSVIPFLLFPKQEEWVNWAVNLIKERKSGVIEKSRDMGVTCLFMAFFCTMNIFNREMVFGVASRKEEYVDELGSPKCLLYKGRQFMSHLPPEFRGSWIEQKHSPFKKIKFPDSNSIISGEAGDGIGRGDRTTATAVDEAAWLMRPELVDASLSQTTNTVFWVSTPHGRNNPFAHKRFGGKLDVFTFHWRDDPRKDQTWYETTCEQIDNPQIIAQEIDLDYNASVEGVVIPAIWVEAAIDAHIKLGFAPTGMRYVGLDVADQGSDLNAFVGSHGVVIDCITAWSGKNSDIYATIEKAFALADTLGYARVYYDSDGLGAGVRGDAARIAEKRKADNRIEIPFLPFRGSGAVVNPTKEAFPSPARRRMAERTVGRTNEDYFENAKAQAWFALRTRFQKTYRAVIEGQQYPFDELISIAQCENYRKLVAELSQPTYKQNGSGKILIDKTPNGARSPNYADACMIRFAPKTKRMGDKGDV